MSTRVDQEAALLAASGLARAQPVCERGCGSYPHLPGSYADLRCSGLSDHEATRRLEQLEDERGADQGTDE